MVDAGHEVLVVVAAPITDTRGDEPPAVRVRAPWVREEHRISAPGKDLELVEERMSIRGVWPAVDLEHQRPALRRVEATRLQDPAFDLPAIRPGEFDSLRRGQKARAQEVVVQTDHLAHRPTDLAGENVARVGDRRDHGRETLARSVERPRDELMAAQRHRPDVTARRRAGIRVRGSLIRAEKEDAPVIGPGWREGLCVRAHVADDRRSDGPIPPREEVPTATAGPWKRPEMRIPCGRSDRDLGPVASDGGTVGRPRRIAIAALAVGDPARLAAHGAG